MPFFSSQRLLVYFSVFRIFFAKRQIHGYLYSSHDITVSCGNVHAWNSFVSGSKASTDISFSWYQLLRFSGIELFCNTVEQEANLLVECMPQTRIEWLSLLWERFSYWKELLKWHSLSFSLLWQSSSQRLRLRKETLWFYLTKNSFDGDIRTETRFPSCGKIIIKTWDMIFFFFSIWNIFL